MKIDAQFNMSPDKVYATLAMAGLPVTTLLLVAALWFIADAALLHQAARQLELRAQALTSKVADLPRADAEKIAELQRMVAEIRMFNSFAEAAQRPVAQVLASIENALPAEGGAMQRLEYGRAPNAMVLQGVAPRAEWVAEFIDRLERQGEYEHVLLSQQSQAKEGGLLVRYEIRLKNTRVATP
ncbi:MAG: PilN domain-containing protein [Pseudomonadota bacterium]